MTADFHVRISTESEFVPGEQGAYVLRVTNEGTTTASATIQNAVDEVFQDSIWVRHITPKGILETSDYQVLGPQINTRGLSDVSQGMADINGDGVSDLFLAKGREAWVLFGHEELAGDLALDSLDGVQGFRIQGFDANISSVSGGGDINGDGIQDLVIGSSGAGPVAESDGGIGKAYIVYGSDVGFPADLDVQSLDGTNGFAAIGFVDQVDPFSSEVSGIGSGVSFLGDVNGDGVDDLAIGGVFQRGAFFFWGASVYVLYGSDEGFPSQLEIKGLGGSTGFVINHSRGDLSDLPASAGDFNGDGFTDIALGWSDGFRANGYLIYGGPDLPSSINLANLNPNRGFEIIGDRIVIGQEWPTHERVTINVAGLGDVNGDDFDDIVLAAPTASPSGVFEAGSAHVIYGSDNVSRTVETSQLDGTNGFSLLPKEKQNQFGTSVSGLESGDGRHAILIGQQSRADESGWLLHLGQLDSAAEVVPQDFIDYQATKFRGATFLSPAGDLNQDGFQDILVGGRNSSRIVLGRPGPSSPIASAGEINEIVELPPKTTAIYEVTGVVKPGLNNPTTIRGTVSSSSDTNPANDVDQVLIEIQNQVDLIVEAGGADRVTVGNSVNLEYVIRNEGPREAVATTITSDFSNQLNEPTWTRTVRTAMTPWQQIQAGSNPPHVELDRRPIKIGDFNGDGVSDVLQLIPNSQPARVLFGGESLGSAAISIKADGHIIDSSSAGDVNGDGLADVFIRVVNQDSYVVFGRRDFVDQQIDLNSLDGTTGFRIRGMNNPSLGRTRGILASAGDFNDDGFDDLIVGASGQSNELTIVAGRQAFESEIVLGELEESARLTTIGGKPERSFWVGPYQLGDFNGDAVGDILVGYEFELGTGQPHVLFGEMSPPEVLNLRSLGGNGIALPTAGIMYPNGLVEMSPVGDVNGDGFDDAIVGFSGDEFADFNFLTRRFSTDPALASTTSGRPDLLNREAALRI